MPRYPFCFFYSKNVLICALLIRLTDPIPTTETSIAPRQRPKAGQAQPQPISSILSIQPAVTPRKKSNAAPGKDTRECLCLVDVRVLGICNKTIDNSDLMRPLYGH